MKMRKMKKMNKTTKIAIVIVLIGVSVKLTSPSTMPVLTAQDLVRHDGSNLDMPVYVALDGYVYDVSPGRDDFYNPGESYHYLAGRDASRELHIFGAALIKKKYQVVGVYKP